MSRSPYIKEILEINDKLQAAVTEQKFSYEESVALEDISKSKIKEMSA